MSGGIPVGFSGENEVSFYSHVLVDLLYQWTGMELGQ